MVDRSSTPQPGARFSIRRALLPDATVLSQIEQDAGQIFRSAPGLEWLAENAASPESYRARIDNELVWVGEAASVPVGFLAACDEAPDVHVVELSVRRAYQRRGVARLLIQSAVEEARRRGSRALTLTTFRNLAWNEQLYTQIGFVRVEGPDICERLRTHLDADAAVGLLPALRCAMKLKL